MKNQSKTKQSKTKQSLIQELASLKEKITELEKSQAAHKKLEETLRESDEKFRVLADSIPTAVMLYQDDRWIYANRAAETICGYSEKELLAMNFWDIVHPDFKLLIQERGGTRQQGKETVNSYEFKIIAKDGSEKWGDLSGASIMLHGRPAGIITVLDINDRKLAEKALKESENKYRLLADNITEHVWLMDLNTKRTIYVSPSVEKMYGYTSDEIIKLSLKKFLTAESFQKVLDWLSTEMPKALANPLYVPKYSREFLELQACHKDGHLLWIENTLSVIRDENSKPAFILGETRDITERKQAEVEIAGVNRALRMLSDTNQALIHITDEATLLNEVCRIIVEVGGYHMAWVSFAEQDEAKTLRPAAHAGFDSGYIESANVTWADNERGRGPSGTAIRTGLPCMARNIPEDPAFAPWREAAIQRGYKSIIALPLISESQALGVLEIYSVDTDAFDTKEVEILKELAGDLAFGIAALRIRAKRDQAEVELRKSEERYRLIAENAADTINIFDLNLNPTRYVSPSITKLLGYTVEEAMTLPLNQAMTPDSLQLVSKAFAEQMALESSPTADPARTLSWELEEYRKDGSTIWVEVTVSLLRDNNFKPTGILTVSRDITRRKQAEERLKETLDRLRKALETTIQVMMSAVESRDAYTAGHQRRSTNLACAIATEMGLSQEKIEGIRMAGSIHDIGKLSIPAEILSKPTKLTNIELSLIKEHSRIGYEMLKDVESPWPLAEIVLQHHERMDGSGYPRNLKGDEIIMEARIMAVADVVETMASHRPYRAALGIAAALEEIEKNKGIIYDNAVADTCLKLFREKGYQLT